MRGRYGALRRPAWRESPYALSGLLAPWPAWARTAAALTSGSGSRPTAAPAHTEQHAQDTVTEHCH